MVKKDDFVNNKDGIGWIFSMKAVIMGDSRSMIASDADPIPVTPSNKKKEFKLVPWGDGILRYIL